MERTEPHIANGATRNQLTLAKLVPYLSFGDEPTFGEAVKNIDRGLVVNSAVAWHAAINALVPGNGHIDTRKPLLSNTPTVL
ncbi:hypothetical protein FHW20_004786 [Ochrobactrum intermedium]|uniref:Uncharacterized protein n=1 Tax=Brucella intermedia TaxID=94625 RepID=A0ABR6AWI6_9HYPH|nr:hypothetical protein [Brucella intermedia]